jgi:hypothetical protein
MKKSVSSLAALLAVASLGLARAEARQAEAQTGAEAKPAAKGPAKTTKVEGEVVAADVAKKQLTLKAEGGDTTTAVGPLAMYRLKSLKAGDKVIVTYKLDDGGAKTEISFIRLAVDVAKPSAAAEEKKN